MTEHPILFSAEMVRAILDGRKTQTRRVVKPQPPFYGDTCIPGKLAGTWSFFKSDNHRAALQNFPIRCPYGVPGDRLWVRETWQHEDTVCDDHRCGQPTHIFYKATEVAPETMRWRPSIHMPRWASRIDLTVKAVRVERVQEISRDDAKAEGVDYIPSAPAALTHRTSFAGLWDSINAKRGYNWDANPWTWVIEFERAEATA